MSDWVVCHKGRGFLYKDNIKERLETNFDKDNPIKRARRRLSYLGISITLNL